MPQPFFSESRVEEEKSPNCRCMVAELLVRGLEALVARLLPTWYRRRAASARARANWVRVLKRLQRLRRLQRYFHNVGTYLRGYSRALLDRLSRNLGQ